MSEHRTMVELLFFTACPHADAARGNLTEAFRRLDTEARWREWDLDQDGLPARLSGFGSPTVLVNGRDVLGPRPPTEGLSCRVDGAPAASAIEAAIREELGG